MLGKISESNKHINMFNELKCDIDTIINNKYEEIKPYDNSHFNYLNYKINANSNFIFMNSKLDNENSKSCIINEGININPYNYNSIQASI
jgi:hypothetical protein